MILSLGADLHSSNDELSGALRLAAQGKHKPALKALERVRRAAVAENDVSQLEKILELARWLYDSTDGKLRHASGRLAYSTVQNIRFATRERALEQGEEWFDPFAGPQAGS